MKSLIDDKGNEIFNPNSILSNVQTFYAELYKSHEQKVTQVEISNILNKDTPTLPSIESERLEGIITKKEAAIVLYNMKNNKSPGSDGYSVEFLKFFWSDLGDFLVRSINHGYNVGNLSITQREGIITCIPKGDKSKKYIKNWRPISLLNVAYKIASGVISKRIKSVILAIISKDQTGFMADRSTSDCIRLAYDILNYALKN